MWPWKRIRRLESDLEFLVQALKESAENCKHWRGVNSADEIERLEGEVSALSVYKSQWLQMANERAAQQGQSQWPLYSALCGLAGSRRQSPSQYQYPIPKDRR